MIIQFFLTVLLAAIGTLIVLQRTTSRLVRVGILAVVGSGAVFVWVPDGTTAIAEVLGVGRGADLIMYVWVVVTLALILLLYLQVIQLGRKITLLTRALAVAQAREPEVGGEDAP